VEICLLIVNEQSKHIAKLNINQWCTYHIKFKKVHEVIVTSIFYVIFQSKYGTGIPRGHFEVLLMINVLQATEAMRS